MKAVAFQMARRYMMTPDILKEGGWNSDVEPGYNAVAQIYKEHNGADLVVPKPGMSEQEALQLSRQFEPARVDPNWIANLRQRMVKINERLKSEAGVSIFDLPQTAGIARALAAEGPGTLGLTRSREQDLNEHMSPIARVVRPVWEATETAADEAMAVFQGLGMIGAKAAGAAMTFAGIGHVSLDGMTGGNADAHYNAPTSWAQDQDGQWYHNGGKVGLAGAMIANMWYKITGSHIESEMAQYEDTRATATMQASGIEGVAMDAGHVLGSLAPFIFAGPVMKTGADLTLKGLGWLATGGRSAVNLARAVNYAELMSGGKAGLGLRATVLGGRVAGESLGFGAYEAIANGHIEGYGAAFGNGLWQWPVIAMLGAGGNQVDRLLGRTLGLPKVLARTLAGVAEGAGFAGLDPHTWDLAWDFLQNPNTDTRAALVRQGASNMVAMGLLKGISGRTPGWREGAKDLSREEAARVAAEEGTDAATTQRYADLIQRSKVLAGREPAAAQETLAQAREAEGELKVQAAGLDRTRAEEAQGRVEAREQLHEAGGQPRGVESLLRGKAREPEPGPGHRAEFATREEIARLRTEPNTPEKRQRIVELLQESRQALARAGGEFGGEAAQGELRKAGDVTRRLEEARGAGELVQRMRGAELPPRETGPAEREREMRTVREVSPEAARETFLDEGTDPLESPRFRDLPSDLQKTVLGAEDARARREAVLDWKPTRAVTEAELQALGAEPAGEIQEKSPTEVLEARREPSAPRAGQPASLRMRPQLEQEGVPGTEKVRLSDFIREAEGFAGDEVRVPIRRGIGIRGRFSTKGMLAWYHRFWNVIRLPKGEVGQDAALVSHEWSHAMEERSVDWRTMGLTADETSGLMRAAADYYPGFADLPPKSQRSEAWAEFWARFLLEDPLLQKETGAFYNRAMKWLAGKPKVLAQMRRMQDVLQRWRDIGAEGRVEAQRQFTDDKASIQELKANGVMADTPVAKARGLIARAWSWLRNEVHATNTMEAAQVEALMKQGLTKKQARDAIREAGPGADPTRMVDMLTVAPRIAANFIEHGTTDLLGNSTGEGFKAIYDAIRPERWHDFVKWMDSMHSLEIAKAGKLTNLPLEDFQTAAAKGIERNPDFHELADRMHDFWSRVFDYTVDAGLFTHEQVEKFRHVVRDPETDDIVSEGYKYYIPFDRVMEGPQRTRLGRTRGPEIGASVRHQKGSTFQEMEDPRVSIPRLVQSMVTDAHRGIAVKAMLKFGLIHKAGGFVTEVAADKVPQNIGIVRVVAALTGSDSPTAQMVGETMKQIMDSGDDLGGALTLWGAEHAPKGERPVIAYTPHFSAEDYAALPTAEARSVARSMDDKLLWLEMDPDAFESMRDLATRQTVVDALPPVIRGALTAPTRIKRLFATGVNPIFALAQMSMDAATKSVYSRRSMVLGLPQAIGHALVAAVELRQNTELAQLWKNLGGGHGATRTGTEMATPGTSMTMSQLRQTGETWARTMSLSEQSHRFDEFKYVRQQEMAAGRTELEANRIAMKASLDVTGPFHRGGTTLRAYNSITAFFKPGVNMAEQLFRTMSGVEGRDRQVAAITRVTLGVAIPSVVAWWLQKDEKWYQDLSEQDRLNYWWFKVPGMAAPMRLKKGEIGMLFGSLPEVIASKFGDHDPLALDQALSGMVGAFTPNNIIPDVVAPFAEWSNNRSQFSGRPTVPDWMVQTRVPAEQTLPHTRAYANAIGRALNLSPAKIERFLDTASGQGVSHGWDLAENVVTGAGAFTAQGFQASKLPVIGPAFLREHPRSRSLDDLYAMQHDLLQRHGSKLLDLQDEGRYHVVNQALAHIAEIHRSQRAGILTPDQAEQQTADIARRAMETVRR